MNNSVETWVHEHTTRALSSFLEQQRKALAQLAPELTVLVDNLAEFLEGGKLLRPRFMVVGALAHSRGARHSHGATLADLAAAIELVQAAALIHDDVIDHSPMRRGRPAVHAAAEARHRAATLEGSSRDFGVASAVILGDLALTWAEQLAARALNGARDRMHFDALRTEMMAGQYLDILNQAGGVSSAADEHAAARTVIRWKTVPYTVLHPLGLGAAHVGGSHALIRSLEELAVPLGTAFQLRDDVLGAFGSETHTGKPTSGDITEGKRTTLLAHARAAASPQQAEILAAAVGRADASASEIARARAVLEDTGARAESERHIEMLAMRSRQILKDDVAAHATPEAVADLDSLITAATGVHAGE